MLGLTLTRAAQLYGPRPAAISEIGEIDWATMSDRVAHIAAGLTGLGAGPGDRIAVLARNSVGYLETYLAAAWAGLVITPLNNRAAIHEMAFCLSDSGAGLLIHDEANRSLAEQVGKGIPIVPVLIEQDYPAFQSGPAMASSMRAWDDLAGLFYTGGTTGQSKGVMLTHGNILFNGLNALLEFGYCPETVFLHAAPMFHLADGASNFALTLTGATHVFLPEFSVPGLIEAIERYRVTYIVLVPTMIQRLLDHPDLAAHDLSSLRTIGYGAAPMPRELLRRAMERLPQCGFVQAYGMTELSPVAAILSREDHCPGRADGPGPGAAGRATFGVEVKIVDTAGAECPRGDVGEIIVRGPTVMAGYWQRPDLTADAIRGGWMHSGDLARMDANGYLYIEDRLKDMIITGGENVYSVEVENAIMAHPDIAQCAVIGIPSEQWGEAVHAVAVLQPGRASSAEDLIRHCRTLLSAFKCPKTVEFRDALPLTGAGKVQKKELRKPFEITA